MAWLGFGNALDHVYRKDHRDQTAEVDPEDALIGQTIRISTHSVVVDKRLAGGAFATVFEVRSLEDNNVYALKRMVVADPELLRQIFKEITIMKSLPKRANLVQLIDSGSQEQKGVTIVTILMDYCPSSLVDLLNSRLPNHLEESEILQIFAQICLGVASLHYLKPPVIHRDIKVENILIGTDRKYKVCDFGSATTRVIDTFTASAIALADEEIQKFTTLQYRAPEMCDLYQKKIVNEKVDIWALGCLLFKLCFFKTPFEDAGQLGILNGRYVFPPQQAALYSSDLKGLIQICLIPDPYRRPNIYQLINRISTILNVPCPIENIYDAPEVFDISNVSIPTTKLPSISTTTTSSSSSSSSTATTTTSRARSPAAPPPSSMSVPSSPSTKEAASSHLLNTTQLPPPGMRRGRNHHGRSSSASAPISASGAFNSITQPPPSSSSSSSLSSSLAPASQLSSKLSAVVIDDDAAWGGGVTVANTTTNPNEEDPWGTTNSSHQEHDDVNHDHDALWGNVPLAFQTHTRALSDTTKSFSNGGSTFDNVFMGSMTSYSSGSSTPVISQPLTPDSRGMASPTRFGPNPVSGRLSPTKYGERSPRRTLSSSSATGGSSDQHRHVSSKRTTWLRYVIEDPRSSRTITRRLTMEAWRCAYGGAEDPQQPLLWFFTDVLRLTSSKEPGMILRTLHLLHEMLLEGPRIFLTELRKKLFFLEDIKNSFSSKLKETPSAKLIVKYADLLMKQLLFYDKRPEFEGSFSLDLFFAEFMRKQAKGIAIQFLTIDTIRDLQEVYTTIDDVKAELAGTATIIPLDPNDVRFWMTISLVKEAHGLILALLHISGKIRDLQKSSDLHNVNPRTRQIQASFRALYDLARQSIKVTTNPTALRPIAAIDDITMSSSDSHTMMYMPSSARRYCRRLISRGVPLSELRLLEDSTGWDLRVVPPNSVELTDSSEEEF